ncbi:preprotein translocase subunit YajC [Neoehrlichia mikurensis]|uniref:Sec translocon accessory complex subunit YajC n=1 Tax=Neoehrlichia mikurensis TaxID=89586 RepID=A0A9Q9F3V9_9RICK|nr:preprotein translocase subunit YajC [Neoehrlichia mikurensis]QXK91666.1 preprotein translocase subunit YajC [Neoehrlichia mikurensis]QXK92877.1 preprotein translocase subunit YajC [Neoehrlichia mikurensis]QXK93357.1 preprotein translocase subunit YajC [Neoehrlichia mikurensis]UTO55699.1 preprotein translocase subunit YajC [Neoehrlichia mikurensis]UTO56616.1 preprotein translocase subunit YajC [Neoehrlichia mikurensis]
MFFSEAFATSVSSPSTAGIGASIAGFVPLVLIFVVFYFLIIRPQQKKIKEHNKLLDSIKKGDKVVVSGSILGCVNKVDTNNQHLFIEIADGVEVKVLKSSISEVINKTKKSFASVSEEK